ncbi:adenylyltransferase/cytidyltransferase family protein [Fluviicola taffensis]|uniref:D-beta-D-heptose 1-phosphate adenylyltransferase n=1 Tax=Fluviicola taffensis (strain DSM 16823 / NCIMB 13979 / RW262) TaxID=755732 RepID=F2IJK2_FLUTR|nr:adenylyltransferase/cytidyltransferase family protein [Fluviicola taffensis]AEA42890.1 D-beta-D-heptose 1-phosphate adenylyltransferase [Fluviicola taffensis DSM 16823]
MEIFEKIKNKISSLDEMSTRIQEWKKGGEKVVFTNGCFDILHEGHVTYLAKAANFGTKMILAINTDASVKRQGKGEERPINPESSRALILAALAFVDGVVFFDEDTPASVIELLKPSVLVKGADYDANETDPFSKKYIVGRESVLANGGEVKTVPLVEGFSTTNIVKKLKLNS